MCVEVYNCNLHFYDSLVSQNDKIAIDSKVSENCTFR